MKAKGIVTGKFAAEKQAVMAVDKLLSACVRVDQVHTLFLNPSNPGAQNKSSRTEGPQGAQKDTANASAIELEVAPAAAADGLEINAFTGSIGTSGDKDSGTAAQPDGIMIAVETSDNVSQVLAISVLAEYGARDIERADGLWQDRKWPGLDPVPLSSLIARPVRNEENHQAALLRPKSNHRHH